MEMPDVIYANDDNEWCMSMDCCLGDKYHHSRIVEALKAENEELKAKLDKAKDTLHFYAFCQGQDGNIGYRARKTLEEI